MKARFLFALVISISGFWRLTCGGVLFESATMGATAPGLGGAIVGPTQFLGVRFQLDRPARVTAIGGHFRGDGGFPTMFGIIVALDNPSSLPHGTASDPFANTEILALTTIQVPSDVSRDLRAPIVAALPPGDYALIFGSGMFDAAGVVNMVSNNDDLIDPESYFVWDTNSGWREAALTGCRFVGEGEFLDSPSSALLLQFKRTGQHESLTIPLNVFGGVTTLQEWSGLVEVIVSGFGFTTPGSLTDAFYPLEPGNPEAVLPGSVQGLRLSFTGCAANVECGAPRIDDFLVFMDEVGDVTPPYRPAYSSMQAYNFVVDVGSTQKALTLGEGDGGVSDNWGELMVELFAVSRIQDCNENGYDDSWDIRVGISVDCNANNNPDECDINDGASSDVNNNKIADECEAPLFLRADANVDGELDVSDSVTILLFLFAGLESRGCLDALDANDDGSIQITDAIGLLAYLFVGGFSPPAPVGICNTDPTEDELGCEAFAACQ